MNKEYHPVDCGFHDEFESYATLGKNIKINYWKQEGELTQATGIIKDVYATESKEEFIKLNTDEMIRLDHIITIDGKPGPAIDAYEDYANACLDCRIPD